MMFELRPNRIGATMVDVTVHDSGGWCGALTIERTTWDALCADGMLKVDVGDRLSITATPQSVYRHPKRGEPE